MFSAYDSAGVRMLSTALAEALTSVRQASARPLSAAETSKMSEKLATSLMKTHDSGVRNSESLKRAALQAVFAPPAVY